MDQWQLQEAKNRFSEVIEKALRSGPQVVTRRGVETVVIISVKDYQKLTQPTKNLVDFFKQSPLKGVKLDLERVKDFPREVDF
ncbi:MAG: type II toxin-antitoxin system Phd/YefM family antitoxin [Pseudomonadota bacterium]|nr:type II toxin-antitoxin system Phd/YefM family antitoxin [Pseudomonadota bacterium]